MKYHFKVHKEGKGYWGECCELEGCMSQGKTLKELQVNVKEALNLYLDEPRNSRMVFPLPKRSIKGRKIIAISVNPQIALAVMLRNERLKRKWSQKMTAERLGIPLYSYQKLESSKTTNPRWKTLVKLLQIFPNLNLNRAA